ncbi:mechanosensitive channel protein [Erwiniaceae bacterium BAC15a-03b]|uniref:Mechanosensitive channel protein n=1 Tax=Winslowiella arboricola TaxID=2978220 RepID=A0A9J6PYU0_9GAMM|nr:mechanosensitive channel protein [Winslowiella arboricola]MCU5772956.1 mechanosensitive channel protein [Winslowiella arboricola]MCU5780616.1 mechanosensitive channel protein [Winslowiella arboricola]
MLALALPRRCIFRWLLVFTLFTGFTHQALAVSLPAAAVAAQKTQASEEPATTQPSVEDKKSAYAALANILQNDQSRGELIEQLRNAAAAPAENGQPVLTPPDEEQEDTTVLQGLTDVSRQFGGAFASRFSTLQHNIFSAPHKTFNPDTFYNAVSHFLMLAAALFAFWWLIRWLARPLYRRMGRWGRSKNRDRSSWLHLPAMIMAAFVIDLALLALALFAGQIMSDYLNAGSRTIARQQGLFLNAFALIEFFKAILRLIFCPTVPDLRPFRIADNRANYWNTRLSWLSGLIGYGLLVIVPIVSNQVNLQVGALVNVVVMSLITLWALYLIFHNKRNIQQELVTLADRSMSFFALFIRAFALIWHWLACAYFIVLFFFSMFNPGDSLKFMMSATVRSLAIIGIGALISGTLSRWIAKTIVLSPELRRHYPELQKRVNAWVSGLLKLARIITVFAVTLLLLNAWNLFDLWHWLTVGAGEKMVDILIRILVILLFSAVGWTLLASLIESRLASDSHGRAMPSARTRTLLTLFRNALAVVISTITIMILLSEIGVNIAPLLAGAGALGLAVSFGSQTLVKDIITGIFIQFENGMNTGDLVTIGPITGTVERMSIRSVGVRQDTGAYHIIPWSSITTFANFVRGIGSFVANYDVDRNEESEKVNATLQAAVKELMENKEIRSMVIGEPAFAGLVGLTNQSFTVRVSFTTQPLKQWTVRFALDDMVKKHFDAAGIQPPRQTVQVLQTGSDVDGAAGMQALAAPE